jgi:hypothetical protein
VLAAKATGEVDSAGSCATPDLLHHFLQRSSLAVTHIGWLACKAVAFSAVAHIFNAPDNAKHGGHVLAAFACLDQFPSVLYALRARGVTGVGSY